MRRRIELLPSSRCSCSRAARSLSAPTTAFLSQALWNDGQAEIAFYRVERSSRPVRPGPTPRAFWSGTYLVKHDYDRLRQAKAREPTPPTESPPSSGRRSTSFESDNSYQYKRNYVVNASQSDLAPLRADAHELRLVLEPVSRAGVLARTVESVQSLMRSDDYGNAEDTLDAGDGRLPRRARPAARARFARLRLTSDAHELTVLTEEGRRPFGVRASLAGRESIRDTRGHLRGGPHRASSTTATSAPSSAAAGRPPRDLLARGRRRPRPAPARVGSVLQWSSSREASLSLLGGRTSTTGCAASARGPDPARGGRRPRSPRQRRARATPTIRRTLPGAGTRDRLRTPWTRRARRSSSASSAVRPRGRGRTLAARQIGARGRPRDPTIRAPPPRPRMASFGVLATVASR